MGDDLLVTAEAAGTAAPPDLDVDPDRPAEVLTAEVLTAEVTTVAVTTTVALAAAATTAAVATDVVPTAETAMTAVEGRDDRGTTDLRGRRATIDPGARGSRAGRATAGPVREVHLPATAPGVSPPIGGARAAETRNGKSAAAAAERTVGVRTSTGAGMAAGARRSARDGAPAAAVEPRTTRTSVTTTGEPQRTCDVVVLRARLPRLHRRRGESAGQNPA